MRTSLGAVFLLIQLASVFYAQFGPSRYFCWAPNDYMTEYELSVAVNGRALAPEEILRRYQMNARGLKENVPQHLIDVVVEYERIYGRGDRVDVVLHYRVNGREPHVWRLEPQ
jgi:hypothetical protein